MKAKERADIEDTIDRIWRSNCYNEAIHHLTLHCKNSTRVVTCVYCGHKYEKGTPQSQDDRLTAHIKECPKHPMRKVEKENARLKLAILPLKQDREELIAKAVTLCTSATKFSSVPDAWPELDSMVDLLNRLIGSKEKRND